jgi:hypothetical protein
MSVPLYLGGHLARRIGADGEDASRQWAAAQAEHLTELIDAGWTAASAAVMLKRSVIVVQVKARNLGKTFPVTKR